MTDIYATKEGQRYHRQPDCPSIESGHAGNEALNANIYRAEPITRQQAWERNLTPCRDCRPV
jgi:hypothetical protein